MQEKTIKIIDPRGLCLAIRIRISNHISVSNLYISNLYVLATTSVTQNIFYCYIFTLL